MTDRKPIEWALLPLKRYAQFSGRAPRAEYWWFYLGTVVIGWILGIVDAALGFASQSFGEMGILGLIFTLATLVPTIAVTVRRLHDIDRSGFWLLGFLLMFVGIFVPIGVMAVQGNDIADASFGPAILLMIVIGIALLVMGITLFVFSVTRGTIGENRYGPDPYGPDNLEEVFA
jgi:uncharacterized membrane protein YhaH (DUF805 family)